MRNFKDAINSFILENDAWRQILIAAPPCAKARIACGMYYSFHKHNDGLSDADLDEYHALRKWVEEALEIDDVEYMIKVMPQRQKVYYRALLKKKQGCPDWEKYLPWNIEGRGNNA